MGNICMYPITSILKWKRILLTKWKGKVRKTKYRKKNRTTGRFWTETCFGLNSIFP